MACKTLIVAASTLALTGTASAGVIVDTLPANDQANLGDDTAQSFTTGTLGLDTQLASIEIEGPQGTAGGMVLTYALELWTDNDGDHATYDPDALLGTSQVDSVVVGGATITSFNFTGVTLADNTPYIFRYVDAGSTPVDGARMGLTNANAISDGTLFSNGAQVFGNAFDTAMRITTVPVPEPASAALLGLGGLLIARRRRTR